MINMNSTRGNELIIQKAIVSSSNVLPWKFELLGQLYVGDRVANASIGKVHHDDSNYEFASAVKVLDWVFVLERMISDIHNDLNKWSIGAFHDKSHYTFMQTEIPALTNLNAYLIMYVTQNFWNILYPEISIQRHKDS